MQGIAKIISPIGLERFWMKADLPQNLLKKSWDKAFRADPCMMPLALTLQRKNPTGGTASSDNLNYHADKWHRQRQRASREEAYAIPLYNLWVLLAVRCIRLKSTIRRRLTGAWLVLHKARLTLAIPLILLQSVAVRRETKYLFCFRKRIIRTYPTYNSYSERKMDVTKCYNKFTR